MPVTSRLAILYITFAATMKAVQSHAVNCTTVLYSGGMHSPTHIHTLCLKKRGVELFMIASSTVYRF